MAAKFDNADGRLRGRKATARRLRLWSINPLCAMCGKLTNYPDGFQLDHKVPLHKGGLDNDSNLQILHVDCHDRKTMQDMGYKERLEFTEDGRIVW